MQAAALDLTADGAKLLTIGGDHTIALPLLRAAAERHGPVALLHFDAHLDTWDTYFGAEYTHGTPFRRAFEEGILDTEALSHVGTRGPLYGKKDLDDDHRFGFGIVTSADVYYQGVARDRRQAAAPHRRPAGLRLHRHRRARPRPRARHRHPGGGRHDEPRAAGDPARTARPEHHRRRRRRGRARPTTTPRSPASPPRTSPTTWCRCWRSGTSPELMPTVHRNGGDLVVETLRALGARHVFGIPGQHALGLFDALRRTDLRFVSSRVENNAAFAADGYARATGEVGVLFLSTGPGALTALAALQEAYATGVPLLVIASQIPRAGLGGAPQGHAAPTRRPAGRAANVTKSTAVVREAGQIPSRSPTPGRSPVSAPAGPVWVEIPQDVLLERHRHPARHDVRAIAVAPGPRAPELSMRLRRLLDSAAQPGHPRRRRRASLRRRGRAAGAGRTAPGTGRVDGRRQGRLPVGPPAVGAASGSRTATPPSCSRTPTCCWSSAPRSARSPATTSRSRRAGRLIQVDAEARVLESNHPALAIHADAALALAGAGRTRAAGATGRRPPHGRGAAAQGARAARRPGPRRRTATARATSGPPSPPTPTPSGT